jgi:hypothetical protein
MSDKQPSQPSKSYKTEIRRITLALPPLLWCLGFLSSLSRGCSIREALPRATAYTLSGFAGWLVYLRIWRSSDYPFFGFIIAGCNAPMLGPTRTHFPFPKMLAIGLISPVVGAIVVGLLQRLLRSEKRVQSSSAHPLADAEIDLPMTGH